MGNGGGKERVYGSQDQRRAVEMWLRDIGVAYDLPPVRDDDRWPDDRVPNSAVDVGWQFAKLPRAFALCGCGLRRRGSARRRAPLGTDGWRRRCVAGRVP
jgi:hypothetical protein